LLKKLQEKGVGVEKMKVFVVRLDGKSAFIIQLLVKRGVYTVLDRVIFDDFAKAKEFLKNKKNIYLSILSQNMVDEFVLVPSSIQNDNVIRKIIISKLKKDANLNDEIIFNYYPIKEEKESKSILYHIEGIFKKEFDEHLQIISNRSNIKFVTLDRFSLMSISNYCLDVNNYITVYTEKNRTIIDAVKNRELIFSRLNTIAYENEEGLEFTLADDIIKTILYIKQQFRDVEFKTLLVSGSLSENDLLLNHLQKQSGLIVSVIYPYSFIKGMPPLWFNEWIISLGALFAKKEFDFTPSEIKADKQYSLALNIILLLSMLSVGYFGYETYDSYLEYKKDIKQNIILKHRFTKELKSVELLNANQVGKVKEFISLIDENVKQKPFENIYFFNSILQMVNINSLKLEQKGKDFSFLLLFEKKFDDLKSLNKFIKEYNKDLKSLKKIASLESEIRIDYSKRKVSGQLKKSLKKQKRVVPRRRRRRR